MSAPVSDTIKVGITADTPHLTQQGFGTTLIMGYVNHLSDRVKMYTKPSELLTDGYTTAHEVYKKALVLLGQSRKPSQFLVGRIKSDTNSIQKITLTGSFTGGTMAIKVGAVTAAAIPYDATAADIKTALEALDGVTEVTVVRATSAVITVEFTGATDGHKHWDPIICYPAGLTAGPVTSVVTQVQYGAAAETLDVAYAAVKEARNDFFGMVCSQSCTDVEVLATAAIVQTDQKTFPVLRKITAIAAALYNESAPSDLSEKLKAGNYTKTWVIWTAIDDNFLDCAALGLQLTKVPGSSTFMYKNFTGVYPDTITSDQRANLRSKSCNFYESQNGLSVMKDGVVPSGEFIDIILGIDYLTVRMGETVFAGIATLEKLDYDANGGEVVENLMLTSLVAYGVANNLIDEASIVIIIPNIATVPTQDKVARILRDCKFTATLKGAIHTLYIDGSLTI